MSTSNSPAETPDLAVPGETNTGSENTIASASTSTVLTERKSQRSGNSQALSSSVIQKSQQAVMIPQDIQPMEVSDKSRPPKRVEHQGPRSNVSSKSPRRVPEARGSDEHLTADQRLDQLLSESNRVRSPREREQVVGMNLDGSPKTTTVSPSMAMKIKSPPRELTRTLNVIPQNIAITDITSDETGRWPI